MLEQQKQSNLLQTQKGQLLSFEGIKYLYQKFIEEKGEMANMRTNSVPFDMWKRVAF
jgi:hypothetical protein